MLMATVVKRNMFPFLALLALSSATLMPGCDWLSSSENVQRSSPFISDLKLSKRSVFYNEKFSLSFNYDDPQGDIARVIIARTLEGETTPTEATEAWPDNINQYTGIVSFPLSFTKDVPGGRYRITVWAEDDAGHKSNELSEEILLL
jgi:hypothetical protein